MVRTKADARKGVRGSSGAPRRILPVKSLKASGVTAKAAPKKSRKIVYIVTWSEGRKGYENAKDEIKGVFGTWAKASKAAQLLIEKETGMSLKECEKQDWMEVDVSEDGSIHIEAPIEYWYADVNEHEIK